MLIWFVSFMPSSEPCARSISMTEEPTLARMRKSLPVLFFSGDQDPVGLMGHGVLAASASFQRAGMTHVDVRLYPGARHETLHEFCREQVYSDIVMWMESVMQQSQNTETEKSSST